MYLWTNSVYEPPRDKTNNVAVRPAKTQISLSIRPVWSESSLCAQWVAKGPSFLHADSKDSDQTGWMAMLIWVFAGRTLTLLVLSWGGSYELLYSLNQNKYHCILSLLALSEHLFDCKQYSRALNLSLSHFYWLDMTEIILSCLKNDFNAHFIEFPSLVFFSLMAMVSLMDRVWLPSGWSRMSRAASGSMSRAGPTRGCPSLSHGSPPTRQLTTVYLALTKETRCYL